MLVKAHWQDAVLSEYGAGHETKNLRGNLDSAEVNSVYAKLQVQRECDILICSDAILHKIITQPPAVFLLLGQRGGKLLGGDDPLLHEDISQSVFLFLKIHYMPPHLTADGKSTGWGISLNMDEMIVSL